MSLCGARLVMSDDLGTSITSFSCELSHGHRGRHRTAYSRAAGDVSVAWDGDDSLEDWYPAAVTMAETDKEASK